MFSYTRILYPFCEKAIGKPITEDALKEPNYGAISDYICCDIFALCTSSAERLRDLDLSIDKTL